MIGKQILNYKIDSLLGKGGMGTVYLGKHMKMERKVAIKMLHPDLSSNVSLRERFKNEASALAQLQNAHIVTLYDFEESDEGLFLIMEYIEGMELADHINKVSGPINEKSAIHYFTQILDGFNYAHKKKVVHRDIKPSNILINSDDEIKIMDFGIAKIVDSEKSLTKTGTQIGTVFYMSPEQVKGENIDHRSDIYSLGVTLFQMITGQCPYSNDTTEFQIYNNIVNDPLPDPASIYPGASKHLAQVIAKATQKNVEDRFQSCEEFKKALNDTAFQTVIKEPATTEAHKTQIKEPTPTEAPKTQIKEPTPTSSTPPKKKKKTAIIIGVCSFLLLISVISIFTSNSDSEEEVVGSGGYVENLPENDYGGEDVYTVDDAEIICEGGCEGGDSNWDSEDMEGEYPQASERYLNYDDIQYLSKYELKIMRNEIFARYGRIFKSADLKNHFNSQHWYVPLYNKVYHELTEIEKHNINFIKQYE